jgi:hypothetical protein
MADVDDVLDAEVRTPDQLEADCEEVIHLLTRIWLHAGDSDDRDQLAHLLYTMGLVRRSVGEAFQRVEQALLAVAGEKKFEVPNLGLVEIKKATKRTAWDNAGLWAEVVRKARDLAEEPLVVLERCARPSWKVTPLRELGVQIDEWCQETDEGWSVRLPPAKPLDEGILDEF